ncbi:hypothetical protein C8R46DRAFT_884807 [Mycena filopes]|nr:hypothetical protein C8R46DRAFT_884807 [Mycena filopes]
MNPDRFLPEQEQIEFLGRHAGRPSNPALPPSAFFGPRVFPDAGDILRRKLLLPPGAPVNLWCVGEPANPTTRPATPYPLLCTLAIYGSEKKRLSLQGIYREIAARFKYYRWQDAIGVKSWRNSIRHALSLYALFINVQRPVREPGKGEYWILGDISSDVRFTRLRKRNTKKKVTVAGGAEADDSSPSDSSSDSGTSQKAKKRATKSSARPAASKKRTRPNRAVSVDSDVTSDADERNTYHAATRGQAPPRRTSTRTRSHRDPAPPTGNMSRRISA